MESSDSNLQADHEKSEPEQAYFIKQTVRDKNLA